MAKKPIITEEVKKQNNMAFKMRSGNKVSFKNMGSSPAKQKLNIGGEGQDQNKIFNDKGEHIGDYVNDKPVMRPGFKRPVVKKDTPVKPKEGDMEKYSDLEKYDDDNPTGKAEPPKRKKLADKNTPMQIEREKKKKSSDKPVKPKEGDYKKYSDLEKYDDDRPASPNKQAKTKGLGPRTAFGGVKNPELTKTKKPFSTKVMKDGPKKQVTGIDLGKDPNWQPHPDAFKTKKKK